jgi:hypothetical protein
MGAGPDDNGTRARKREKNKENATPNVFNKKTKAGHTSTNTKSSEVVKTRRGARAAQARRRLADRTGWSGAGVSARAS